MVMTTKKTAVMSQAPPPLPGFCSLKPLPGLQRAARIGAYGWSPYPKLLSYHYFSCISFTIFSIESLIPMDL
eukprot:14599383-Ditylum_brightwellii.AAC.1